MDGIERMRQIGQRAVVCAVLLVGAGGTALPAFGFEIFGIRLWGSEEDEFVDVIDPVPYSVELRLEPADEGLEQSLRTASALWEGREAPVAGRAGLISRARGDYRRLLAALYNAGYYGPEISIMVAGREAAELAPDVALPPEVPVTVLVRQGPRFRFGVAEIVNPPVWAALPEDDVEDPASVGFETGRVARAAAVGVAAELAVEQWRQLSHAKAREVGRDVVADHATNLLDVTIRIDPDRPARYGPTRVEGTRRVDPGFVAFMADLPEGQPFDPDEVVAGQARLARLGVFRSIRIDEAEEIGPDGRLPMFVRVEDRPARTLGFGASLSTLDGVGLEAFWVHRNLLGRAEQLRLEAGVLGLGETTDFEDLTYNLGVSFMRPGVWTPDTNFVTSLIGRQQDLETYRERALTGRVGLQQAFGTFLTGDLFFEVSRSRIRDDLGVRRFLTFGPGVRAQYDRRDDPVDATAGYFLLGETRPFYEAEFGNAAIRNTVEGRIYRSLDADSRFVLAARGRVGSYLGPSAAESPPDQLFFAGGGGSVRGYAFRSIGADAFTVEGETVVLGGRSAVETSGELRARFGARFGAVGFVDAGFVSPESDLSGGDWRFGAGVGVRYFTGFGPLRVDVAVPVDPRPQDSSVALYIGIGQAF